jgi:hypothetical protein
MYGSWNNQITSFNTAKTAYDTKKDEYNNALKSEKLRAEDFFSFWFTPATVIPLRPCPVSSVIEYSGPKLKLEDPVKTTPVNWSAVAASIDKTAYLAYLTTNMPVSGAATRRGYIAATSDDTGTSVANVGHVFGRLGEGEANYPGNSAPFYWGTAAGSNTPGIMVSFWP